MKTTKTTIIFLATTFVFVCVVCVPIVFDTNTHMAIVHAEDTSWTQTLIQAPANWLFGSLLGGTKAVAGFAFDYTIGPLITYLGIGLISLAGKFLTLTAVIFNWAFEKTVIDLPGTLNALGITNGLETVWGAFRDIANIIIIGVMVYIAIATIIGIEEYGYKRLLAGALIVATLINFSLFFSRFAIDAANIVSYQVYKSITGNNGGMNIGTVITGRAGVTTWAQTTETVQKIANSPDGGVWSGFLYAIITCGVLGMFAAILLYGSFLLISRGVLLVFLMVSSSVAFASRILPAWRKASYGWDKWLETLIDAAVFGPLLTFLLWVSLTLLNKTAVSGSIGDAIDSGMRGNTNGGSWDSLMVSLFTIAFLYISIKVAHEMANKISGFSTAAKVPGAGILASGLLGSKFLRGTVGWGANKLYTAGKNNNMGSTSGGRLALRALNSLQNTSFNPFTNKNVAKAAGGMGIPGTATTFAKNYGKGGIIGDRKRAAEKATDNAEITTASKDVVDTKAGNAGKTAREEASASTEKQIGAINSSIQGLTQALSANQEALKAATSQREKIAAEKDSEIRIAEQEVAMAQHPSAKNAARARLAQVARERQSVLAEEDQRIQAAQSAVTATTQKMATMNDRLKSVNDSIAQAGAQAESKAREAYGTVQSRAEEIAKNRSGTGFGLWAGKNDPVATLVSDTIKNKGNKKRIKELAVAVQEETPKEEKSEGAKSPEKK